jgi:hypothetical protein
VFPFERPSHNTPTCIENSKEEYFLLASQCAKLSVAMMSRYPQLGAGVKTEHYADMQMDVVGMFAGGVTGGGGSHASLALTRTR